MTTAIILTITGLILSAFFSGSEIAVIRANPLQLQVWKLQKKRGAVSAYNLFEKRERLITLILIGNNLANILTTTFATLILTTHYTMSGWLVIILVSTCILIVGEVIPKSLVRQRPNSYLIFTSAFMSFINHLLAPLTYIFENISSWMVSLFKSSQSPASAMVHRKEIEESIYNSYHDIVMDTTRKKYLSNILDFSETTAGEIITPRTDMIAVDEDCTLKTIKKAFSESGFSKILVYRDNIDQIIGYISLRDILNGNKKISSLINTLHFYPESKSIIDILKEFQKFKISIAVILDEFSGTAGMITMEDIVEEIFGEFSDEYEDEQNKIKKLSNGELLTSGRTEIDILSQDHHISIPDGDYETVAGFLLFNLNRFPQAGEVITLFGAEYSILKSTAKSIDQLKIKKLIPKD